jgi:hypothetical protein
MSHAVVEVDHRQHGIRKFNDIIAANALHLLQFLNMRSCALNMQLRCEFT